MNSPHQDHGHHDHGHGHHHGHRSPEFTAFLSRLLDLDAHVNAGMIEEALNLLAGCAGDPAGVRRILDIGAGTGTGTLALARRFPAAEVLALDIDGGMLRQVRERAAAGGLADRVSTREVDIAAAGPELGQVDLVWSAAAIHEVADPECAFLNIFAALRPGGWLALIEMDAPPRLLPESHAEFEERLHTRGPAMPSVDHPDWSAALAAVGFEVRPTHTLRTGEVFPAAGPAGDFAALELRRLGQAAQAVLSPADRELLRTLTGEGPANVRTLGELPVRATRTLWLARRP